MLDRCYFILVFRHQVHPSDAVRTDQRFRIRFFAMDSLEILETLCLQPTVSYHEHRVAREITNILVANNVNPQRDRWGNVIARLEGDSSISPLVFVAHMDHPGFEAIEAVDVNEDEEVIVAEPRGGLGFRAYERGTGVHVIGRNGVGLHGTIESRENLRRVGRFRKSRESYDTSRIYWLRSQCMGSHLPGSRDS